MHWFFYGLYISYCTVGLSNLTLVSHFLSTGYLRAADPDGQQVEHLSERLVALQGGNTELH